MGSVTSRSPWPAKNGRLRRLYEAEIDEVGYPSHEGFFDMRNGDVVAAPPTRLLPYRAEVRDGDVWAVGYQVDPRQGDTHVT